MSEKTQTTSVTKTKNSNHIKAENSPHSYKKHTSLWERFQRIQRTIRARVLAVMALILFACTFLYILETRVINDINTRTHNIIDNQAPITESALHVLDEINDMTADTTSYINGDVEAYSAFQYNHAEYANSFAHLKKLVPNANEIPIVEQLATNFVNEAEEKIFQKFDPTLHKKALESSTNLAHSTQNELFDNISAIIARYSEDEKITQTNARTTQANALLPIWQSVSQMIDAIKLIGIDDHKGAEIFIQASYQARINIAALIEEETHNRTKAELDAIALQINHFTRRAETLFDWRDNHDANTAIETSKILKEIYVARMEDILEKFVSENRKEMQNSVDTLVQDIDRFSSWLSGIQLTIMLTIIGAVLYINISVLKPIRKIQNNLFSMRKGNYDNQFPINKHDEIGEIAESLDLFQGELLELEKLRTEDQERLEREHNSKLQKAYDALKLRESDLKAQTINMSKINAELRQFVHIASHDLREPMKNIVGFSTVLQKDLEDKTSPMGETALARIQSSCDRMLRLIDDLRSLATIKMDEDKTEQINLREVLSNELADQNDALQKMSPVLDIGTLPTITAVPSALHQVIHNVVSNAIKYGKSPLYFSVMSREEKDKHIITFKNNLPEPSEFDERIFLPFWRGSNSSREHSGIGLALTKKIVEEIHGGKVYVESSGEAQDHFTITFEFLKEINLKK